MKNLFINQIKKIAKQKFKFFGLVILVILSVSIYASMMNLFSPLKSVIASFDQTYNAEEFRLNFTQSYLQNKLTEMSESEQIDTDDFTESPNDLVEHFITQFEAENQLSLEENKFKQLIQINKGTKQKYIFVTDMAEINQTNVIEGQLPEKKNEVALNPQALEQLGLKIGDTLSLDNKERKITGTFIRPDYITLSNLSAPSSIEPENNFLVLTPEESYEKIDANEEIFYSGRFDGEATEGRRRLENLVQNNDIQLEYATENPQMNALTERIKTTEMSGVYFSVLVLIIASFMIGFIVKRDLQQQKKTIGVFKAQGYNSIELIVPYTAYAVFLSLVGSGVGYFLGSFIAKELRKSFLVYFNVPEVSDKISTTNLLTIFGIVTILLTIVVLVVAISIVKKPVIELLADTKKNNRKMMTVNKKKAKESKIETFLTKLMVTIFFRNGLRNSILVLSTVFTTFLLLVSFIQFTLPDQTIEATEKQIGYEYFVSYFRTQDKKIVEGQKGYSDTGKIVKINTDDQTVNSVTISLLDFSDKNYWHIVNKSDEDISQKIRGNQVVISQFFQQMYGLSKGDQVTVQMKNETVKLIVADISADLSKTIYGDFTGAVFKEVHEQNYNELYSNKTMKENNKEYQVISVQEYVDNASLVAKQLQAGSYTIGLIALIISFVLINISSSISLEVNKKNIAVLEILGYSDKEIEKVLFRIPLLLVITVSILTNFISPYLFSMMENQLISQLGSPAKIAVTSGMMLLAFFLTVGVFFLSQQIQRRNMRKINIGKTLFEE